ncbi:MAG: hypothetical protein Q9162_002496 [Coniocarpon cinnabarinum]
MHPLLAVSVLFASVALGQAPTVNWNAQFGVCGGKPNDLCCDMGNYAQANKTVIGQALQKPDIPSKPWLTATGGCTLLFGCSETSISLCHNDMNAETQHTVQGSWLVDYLSQGFAQCNPGQSVNDDSTASPLVGAYQLWLEGYNIIVKGGEESLNYDCPP